MSVLDDVEVLKKQVESSDDRALSAVQSDDKAVSADVRDSFNSDTVERDVELAKFLMQNPNAVAKARVGQKLGQSIGDKLDTDEVQSRVDETAERVISNELNAVEHAAQTDSTVSMDASEKADFERNKHIYLYFGFDKQVSKKKADRMMRIKDFWDNLQITIAAFTTVPVAMWLDKTKQLNRKLVQFLWVSLPIILLLAGLSAVVVLPILKSKGVI